MTETSTDTQPESPTRKQPWLHGFAVFCVVWLAITLQFQSSLLEQLVSLGLRLSLSDMLLPPAGLIVCYSLIRGQSKWPVWVLPHMHIWLGALSALIVMAMVNSYLIHGYLIPWAFINKTIGWFVLMAYIFLAGWLVTNFDRKLFILFLQSSCFVFLGIQLVSLIGFIINDIQGVRGLGLFKYPLDGYMANRNAFGFVQCILLLFGTVMLRYSKSITWLWCIRLLWLLTPITLMYNGSRAALFVIILIGLYLLLTQPKFFVKSGLIALLIGCIALPFTQDSHTLKIRPAYGIYSIVHPTAPEKPPPVRPADRNRMLVAKDALALWQKSPIFGAGLGTFLVYQESKYGAFIEIIDSAPLWLLTEVGAIGLLAFMGFYIAILLTFWTLWKSKSNQSIGPPDFTRNLFAAALFFLILFAVESLVYQMLYARHLWVVLGFLLAVPAMMKNKEH